MNTEALCACIVYEIESRASETKNYADNVLDLCDDLVASVEFSKTHLGRLRSSGVRVRFEGVTLHD